MVLLVLALAACNTQAPTVVETAAPQQPQQVCPTAAPCPTAVPAAEPVVAEVPFQDEWVNSPHADSEAEAFIHWNEEDPQEIPANCAKCHSTPGYLDFLGEDGTAFGTVENAAPVGTVITCDACHNATTASMTSVVFPSGAEITGLEEQARCMQCHQGRASKVSVDESLAENNLTEDLDTPNAELSFINIHYYAAATTLYGTMVKGGYEYDGKSYDSKFEHVEGYDNCVGCHNPHSTELRIDACAGCHQGVAAQEDLRNIRMLGSLVDNDGDGDTEEGMAFEVEGLRAMLLQAIQAYANEVSGTAIAYNPAAHPYWFIDTNGDGEAGEDESVGDNGYNAWTGRLLKAGYNYQVSLKDPGAYAHNGKYIIELLYDSIEDLNTQLGTQVDLTAANRTDAGHFAGSEEAFRHWDEEETHVVPGDCAKCHTAEGLPTFLGEASRSRDQVTGVNVAVTPANGLECTTCHNDLSTFTRYEVTQVRFPSGAVLGFETTDPNLCISCHQGRESKSSVDRAITNAGVGDDEVSDALAFRNPHYFAAGATLFGTQAQGAYEYDGQEYNGRFLHVEAFDTCVECHNVHALTVQTDSCQACHGSTDLATYRSPDGDAVDYDGDGDMEEGLAGEVATMQENLLAAIQTYAAETAGTPIQYNPLQYPYFLADPNANGQVDEGEGNYTAWTPRLLRAAYNYQWVAKDPGAFAHNGKYVLQFLYDSLNDVGGSAAVTGMTRPEVTAAPEEPQ
jgi:hypothetical protein